MIDELKLCPFCGSEPQFGSAANDDEDTHVFIVCRNCGAKTSDVFERWTQNERDEDLAKLTTDWNTRPLEDALRAQLASRDALIERLVDCGDALNEFIPDPEDNGIELSVVLWNALKTEWQAMKGGEK